jgi:hypothetical protein
MGATLTGTRISDTYDSLLKATDNGIITSSAKQITDGVGTNTPLYISTSRIGIGVSPTTTFQVSGNSKIGGDLTVTGNLLVEGTTTTVDTDTLSVKDPLIIVGNDNNTSDLVDLGFYGLYDTSGSQDLYAGLYRSASDTKFHLFKDLQEEPTTTVNTSGTGYAVATLVSDLEGTLTGVIASTTTATTQSANDNSTKVATTAYVDNQVGLYDTLSEVLANGNTSGANDIIMEDGQKVNFGTDSDLEMYHDGTDGYIDNINGELILQNNSDDKKIIFKSDNGIGDITEYFRIDGNINRNVITVTTQLNDDVPLIFGDGAARPSIKYDSTATDLIVSTNGSTALTIDTSQNATFSGTISGVLADGVTATTQSDGDNSTKVATTAYVDTAIEGHDTLAEVLSGGNTTGGTDIAVSAGDDITFTDTSKAYFGTGNDLQIYHDGSNSYIDDNGTGHLFVRTNGDGIYFRSETNEEIAHFNRNAGVKLYYDNSLKFETTSTGADISGTSYGRLTLSDGTTKYGYVEGNTTEGLWLRGTTSGSTQDPSGIGISGYNTTFFGSWGGGVTGTVMKVEGFFPKVEIGDSTNYGNSNLTDLEVWGDADIKGSITSGSTGVSVVGGRKFAYVTKDLTVAGSWTDMFSISGTFIPVISEVFGQCSASGSITKMEALSYHVAQAGGTSSVAETPVFNKIIDTGPDSGASFELQFLAYNASNNTNGYKCQARVLTGNATVDISVNWMDSSQANHNFTDLT